MFKLARQTVSAIAKESTIHGLANLLRTEFKILWVLSLIASGSVCFHIIIQNLLAYLEYQVISQIRFVNQDVTDFPAVMVCNTNPYVTNFSIDFLCDYIEANTNSTFSNTTGKLDFLNRNLFLDDQLRVKLYVDVRRLNDSFKRQLGFNLSELLIRCEFYGEECNLDHFEWIYHWNHGSCFVFNRRNQLKVTGAEAGLSLELFAGFEELIPSHETIGFQVMLYNQSEDDKLSYYFKKYGFEVGSETRILFHRTFLHKLPKPHSECDLNADDDVSLDTINSALYHEAFLTNRTYTRRVCFHRAHRQLIYRKCHCVVEVNDVMDLDAKLCMTKEETRCAEDVYYIDYLENSFNGEYDIECPLECNSREFSAIITSGVYPSHHYANYLLKTHKIFQRSHSGRAVDVRDVKRSVAKVSVQYQTLGYTLITEIEAMSVGNLLANTGSFFGLFMGMSVLSFMEIFEIVVELVRILIQSSCGHFIYN